MKPIKAPRLLQTGIAVYVPAISEFDLVKLQIFYSPNNPLFNWSYCDESPYLIWEKTDQNFDRGLLFLYNTNKALNTGYYKIDITMTNNSRDQTLQGSQVYGVLDRRNTLYIGLPYSAFPPIDVT